MRPALLSVADQLMLKRELAKLRSITTQQRVKGVRRHQGGGVRTAREEHVQVWEFEGDPAIGDVRQSNDNRLFLGRSRSWFNGTDGGGRTCWIGFVDWYDADTSQAIYAIQGKHYYARRAGSVTSEGTSLPFYVATMGNFECWCQPDADIAAEASGTVRLYNNDFTDSGLTRASTLVPFIDVVEDQWCLMSRTMGTYIVQPAACAPEA